MQPSTYPNDKTATHSVYQPLCPRTRVWKAKISLRLVAGCDCSIWELGVGERAGCPISAILRQGLLLYGIDEKTLETWRDYKTTVTLSHDFLRGSLMLEMRTIIQ